MRPIATIITLSEPRTIEELDAVVAAAAAAAAAAWVLNELKQQTTI